MLEEDGGRKLFEVREALDASKTRQAELTRRSAHAAQRLAETTAALEALQKRHEEARLEFAETATARAKLDAQQMAALRQLESAKKSAEAEAARLRTEVEKLRAQLDEEVRCTAAPVVGHSRARPQRTRNRGMLGWMLG